MADIVDSYSESNQDGSVTIGSADNQAVGQAFTGNGKNLDSCKFYLLKNETPTGNAVAKLYASTGTFGTNAKPNGTALAVSNNLDVSTLTGSFQLKTFTFDGTYTLVNGTKYIITIEYSDASSVDVGSDSSSPSHLGNYSENSGSWSGYSSIDLCFYIYSTDPLNATTQPASAVTKTTATLNGNITATGGVNPTIRGFQYNTVEYPDKATIETGDFGTGAFTANITGLTPNTLYYFRSYATNSAGTSYGSWETFTTDPATYNISIGGVDRTTDVLNQTATVEDILNDQQNTCNFALIDRSGSGIPATDDEIIITLDDATMLFSGYIQKVDLDKQPNGVILAVCQCIDQVWLLDRNLVHKTYEAMTDKAIIQDIISTYCAGFGITTTNVVEGVTISQISFNYIQPSQALRKICDVTNRNWYIDYSKDIHYFPLLTNTTPFNIDSSNNDYSNLKISKDNTQLKNRVYVRGGTKLSDPTTYSVKGDGVARQFPLPDKPHDVSITVGGVAKTIGIKNIDTSGFDWYLNFQEKYIEQDTGGTVVSSATTIVLTYTYDIPILVAVENTQSIIDNGVKEFAIFDKSITTTQAARDRASAELTDYAADIIEGSFSTHTSGFISGQYININLTEYGVNADYIVQKVTAKSFGGGNYEYDISIASAKTMGIIRFLIELLETNKNLVELDDSESVDELLALTDLLYSDSITETLTIDSAGAYRTWCQDSLETTNTRARWGLFEWGGNS